VAVYNPDDPSKKSFKKCYELTHHADRVHFMAPADYRKGSLLRMILEQHLTEIADSMVERRRQGIEGTRVAAPPP